MDAEEQRLQDCLNAVIAEQKRLTGRWYAKISGEQLWKPNEREAMEDKFESQNRDIHNISNQTASLEFARLEEL